MKRTKIKYQSNQYGKHLLDENPRETYLVLKSEVESFFPQSYWKEGIYKFDQVIYVYINNLWFRLSDHSFLNEELKNPRLIDPGDTLLEKLKTVPKRYLTKEAKELLFEDELRKINLTGRLMFFKAMKKIKVRRNK